MKIQVFNNTTSEKLKSNTATYDLNNVTEWGRIMKKKSFTSIQPSPQRDRMPLLYKVYRYLHNSLTLE